MPQTMTPHQERVARYDRVIAAFQPHSDIMDPLTLQQQRADVYNGSKFVLVERGSHPASAGEHAFTTYDTPEQAAAEHDGQESAEDWPAVALVDLTTGVEMYAVTRTAFEPWDHTEGPRFA